MTDHRQKEFTTASGFAFRVVVVRDGEPHYEGGHVSTWEYPHEGDDVVVFWDTENDVCAAKYYLRSLLDRNKFADEEFSLRTDTPEWAIDPATMKAVDEFLEGNDSHNDDGATVNKVFLLAIFLQCCIIAALIFVLQTSTPNHKSSTTTIEQAVPAGPANSQFIGCTGGQHVVVTVIDGSKKTILTVNTTVVTRSKSTPNDTVNSKVTEVYRAKGRNARIAFIAKRGWYIFDVNTHSGFSWTTTGGSCNM